MTDLSGLIAGVVLLLLLLALAIKGWLRSRELLEPALPTADEDGVSICPEEFVSRVFSRDDGNFVRKLGAFDIERLFQKERKKVALLWVRQTANMIRKLMAAHARAARQSRNLEFSTEISILSQFVISMAACAVLSLAVQVAGPPMVASLAQLAQRLSQRMAKVHEAFEAGALTKTTGGTA
jgi:hypothetical protein